MTGLQKGNSLSHMKDELEDRTVEGKMRVVLHESRREITKTQIRTGLVSIGDWGVFM